MCRLMAFSSKQPVTIPEFIGGNFSEFLELSKVHHDAWGIALDSGTDLQLNKAAETAIESSNFLETLSNRRGVGGLLHFRWASPGLPATNENAHPFMYQDISFIHNGALSPYDALETLVSNNFLELRTGDTDSELFFLYLLTEVSKTDFKSGVIAAIRNIKANFKYSSINSIIMNKEFLIVVCENDPVNKPDWADDFYYELRYRINDEGFAVASSGWNQSDWQQIKNHHILILDRKSLESEIIQL